MEINFDKVNYTYNKNTISSKKALIDIETTFEDKKIHGLTGSSGSGKTTMVELINALKLPEEGSVKIGSKVLSNTEKNIKALRADIGLVFQFPEQQFFLNTVEKEIEHIMKVFNKIKKDPEKHIKDALLMVGLDESYLKRNPLSLSSGEMRKVAIASVLAFNPKIIILDEPFICLDEKSKDSLLKIIKMLKNRYNKTIIIVSTDTDLLHRICDNIVVLYKGKIVLKGNKYEVFTKDIEKYGLKKPKIIQFEQLVLKEKKVRLGYRDDINDLMKDIYRNVK